MRHQPNNFKEGAPSFIKWFIVSGGAILLITGLAKIVTSLGKVQALSSPDPVFGITFHRLELLAGIVELVIGIICVVSSRKNWSLFLIFWIAANFLTYHMTLWLIGWVGLCPCLGNLTDALHVSAPIAEKITVGISIYLLIGACLSWWCLAARETRDRPMIRN